MKADAPRFGLTALQERRLAGSLDFAGVVLAIWVTFYPRPYGLAVSLAAGAPFIAIVLTAVSRGGWSLNGRLGAERPQLGSLLLLPMLALGARAILDFTVVDWKLALALAVAAGVAITVAIVWTDRSEMAKPFMVVVLLLAGLDYGWGLVIETNVLFDSNPSRIVRTRVMDKTAGGRRSSYTIKVEPLTANQTQRLEFRIGKKAFNALSIGSPVCVLVHPGAFGWRWAGLVKCARKVGGA